MHCKFMQCTSTKDIKDAQWYSFFCKASPRKKEFNSITGMVETPKQEFEFCNVINRGDCEKFIARSS